MEMKFFPHLSQRYLSQVAMSRSRFMGPPPPHMILSLEEDIGIFQRRSLRQVPPGFHTPKMYVLTRIASSKISGILESGGT